MPKFSTAFGIDKSQAELDFVDVALHTDNPVFLDPFAISQRPDHFSYECHLNLINFFQQVVDFIRKKRGAEALAMLQHFREPNETRLGYSARRPQGAGIGEMQAGQLFEAFEGSSAVETGFLSSLEECELMIDGIARDKISDLTTNILRGHLVKYTQAQCELHGIETHSVGLQPWFDATRMDWMNDFVDLPMWHGRPILLVPKAFVRYDPSYKSSIYYNYFVLPALQGEHLAAGSALVRTLKNGAQRVCKVDLKREYPCTKKFLYEFSRDHPEVLREYRNSLSYSEQRDRASDVDPEDEPSIAIALSAALPAIEPGDRDASAYHRLMVGVAEFLFFPKLLYPRKEREIHQGRKRIDFVMDNGAHDGVFHQLPNVRKISCIYVPFECKNYSTEVSNPEIDQLAGRFSENRGWVGFLCCRRFENRDLFVERCRDTYKDDRGVILPLDDVAVLRMLELVRTQHRAKLESELSDLLAEVCLA